MKIKYALIGAFVLLVTILPGRHIKYGYEINSYKITLSFWALGPYAYTEIESPGGRTILFRQSYNASAMNVQDLINVDDYILSRDSKDTIYVFSVENMVENNGFVVETVIPPHWEKDIKNDKIYHLNLGNYYEKLFHKEQTGDILDYETLDKSYFRITSYGESLYIHMCDRKLRKIHPLYMEEKIWGIIPIKKDLKSSTADENNDIGNRELSK